MIHPKSKFLLSGIQMVEPQCLVFKSENQDIQIRKSRWLDVGARAERSRPYVRSGSWSGSWVQILAQACAFFENGELSWSHSIFNTNYTCIL